MRILSLIIAFGIAIFLDYGRDNPHGKDFKISCSKCHSPEGWHLDKKIYSFDHSSTRFPLKGEHNYINCRDCHKSLIFSEAQSECSGCHKDVHESTVGDDCGRCHSSESWLVTNITELHRLSRFPLLGAHRAAECDQCHISANKVLFNVKGINCVDCHLQEYLSASTINHVEAGFSQECNECHSITSFEWGGVGFTHGFFPLVESHSGHPCNECHTTGRYTDANPECNSCHSQAYLNTSNPNHTALNFQTVCSDCHTLAPGWKPAAFRQHDAQYFPVYTGKHAGRWDSCSECHPSASNYSQFTCISCHEHNKSEMDSKHREESGYSYTSSACIHCHPRGIADDK